MAFSTIKIDLRLIHSVKDVIRFMKHYNIDTNVDANLVFDCKKAYDCLFLDGVTFQLVAHIEKGKSLVVFNNEFLFQLGIPAYNPSEAKALEKKEKKAKKEKVDPVVNLSLDYILDKIGEKGIESLTINEKSFLEECSKK